MATITPTVKDQPGDDIPTISANAGGDMVTNAGGVVVLFFNGDASSKTVNTKSYYGGTPPAGTSKTDFALVVAAGAIGVIGPLDAAVWNNPATGQVELTYSAVTTCKVGAYSLT